MMKRTLMTSTALLACVPVFLMGCTMTENALKFDRETNQEFQDVRDAMAPREIPIDENATAPKNGIPEFTDYTSTNTSNLKSMPLVSVSVNETIPLKDVLYELAQQAHYDLEIDPRIDGAIIFSAKNRPFDEVMSRIADLAGLRFKFDNDIVRVEMDTPYSETYKIGYLPMARTVTTQIQNNATFAGSGEGEGGGSATSSSGSTFSLSGKTEVDFWKELDTNIKQILESNSLNNALRTNKTPIVTQAPVVPAPTTPAKEGADGTSATVPTDATATPAPPAAPTTTAPAATPTTDDKAAATELVPTYSVNKQAGLLSVFANEKVQKKIKGYLDELRRQVSSQVLIEARILEVNLNDDYATGINWGEVGNSLGDVNLSFSGSLPSFKLNTDAPASTFSAGINGSDFQTILQAISRFGSVHALSSPRLTVLNNQSAVLNVATNRVYFEIKQDQSTSTGTSTNTTSTIDVTAKSVPEGVLVNVTPSIDTSRGEVSLTLRPTITRITKFVVDPSLRLIGGSSFPTDIQNRVPELSVQEFDSVLKVKSGETIVMGGLISDRTSSGAEGIPILSETPLIGSLFKSQRSEISKTELVLFLRATILDSGKDTIHQTDKDLYKTFGQDRRPLPM